MAHSCKELQSICIFAMKKWFVRKFLSTSNEAEYQKVIPEQWLHAQWTQTHLVMFFSVGKSKVLQNYNAIGLSFYSLSTAFQNSIIWVPCYVRLYNIVERTGQWMALYYSEMHSSAYGKPVFPWWIVCSKQTARDSFLNCYSIMVILSWCFCSCWILLCDAVTQLLLFSCYLQRRSKVASSVEKIFFLTFQVYFCIYNISEFNISYRFNPSSSF